MPTGSYEGVVDEVVGLGCSASEGGEDDICGGGPCDVQQAADLYSGIIRHGRLEYHGLLYSSLALSIPSQLFQYLVQTSEMVVDRRPVLFATHRLQRKKSG